MFTATRAVPSLTTNKSQVHLPNEYVSLPFPCPDFHAYSNKGGNKYRTRSSQETRYFPPSSPFPLVHHSRRQQARGSTCSESKPFLFPIFLANKRCLPFPPPCPRENRPLQVIPSVMYVVYHPGQRRIPSPTTSTSNPPLLPHLLRTSRLTLGVSRVIHGVKRVSPREATSPKFDSLYEHTVPLPKYSIPTAVPVCFIVHRSIK